MEPKRLKETYGKDFIFWGGGVDTQKVLPFGKPEDVREQVLERLDIFSKDGGYIFNTIHNIQANVPIENIAAMIEAIKEFNGDKQLKNTAVIPGMPGYNNGVSLSKKLIASGLSFPELPLQPRMQGSRSIWLLPL